jgi:lysophospholipase L1-like esterase
MPLTPSRTLPRCPRPVLGLAFGLTFGFALVLSACGGGGSGGPVPPEPVPVVAPGTWVVMGSSSAAGQGATAGQSWAVTLAAAHAGRGVTLRNIARGGTLTPMARPAAAPAPADRPAPDAAVNVDTALAPRPALLLLSFPTNDTAAGYPADETVGHLRVIRQAAAAAQVPVLVLGTQPRDAFTTTQRATLAEIDRQLAAATGPCFVPLFEALADAQGAIRPEFAAGDGIHLNDAGHAVVRQRVQAVLDGGRCVRLSAP